MNDLIMALRCSAGPIQKGHSCEGCKYRLLEEYDSRLPIPPDCEIDGVSYYESCNTGRMILDAADMLEEVMIYEDDRK